MQEKKQLLYDYKLNFIFKMLTDQEENLPGLLLD
jgi:hypothetical protein